MRNIALFMHAYKNKCKQTAAVNRNVNKTYIPVNKWAYGPLAKIGTSSPA